MDFIYTKKTDPAPPEEKYMQDKVVSPGQQLMQRWQQLSSLPGGPWLFSFILGRFAPYTGSIGARVRELRPGYASVELRDRRKIRNHLNSIHAIALMNLGEMTTGLALISGLQPGVRGIITGLSIEYHKKARGRLFSECSTKTPEVSADMEQQVYADIKDQSGEVVARCTATWRLGLIP